MAIAVDAQSVIYLRRPADAGFLARKVLSIDWAKFGQPVPLVRSLPWLIEACRAELAWSRADYCRLTGVANLNHSDAYDGPHPSEAHRLPVEHLAARVLNAWGHVHVETGRIRHEIEVLRRARDAADRMDQSADYRASWAQQADGIASDLRQLLGYRRKAWPVFVGAAREYRHARHEVDVAAIGRAA